MNGAEDVTVNVATSLLVTVILLVPLVNPEAAAVTITATFPSTAVLSIAAPTNVMDVAFAGMTTEPGTVIPLRLFEASDTVNG